MARGKIDAWLTKKSLAPGLFGFGLAIVLINFLPELGAFWLGLVLVVAAVILDYKSK